MKLAGKLLAQFGLLFAATIAVSSPALALEVPPTPNTPVVDQTGTLTQEQINALVQKIDAQEKSTGNEIAVLMVKSLEGEALEDYSIEVARKWGIGQKDRNSGVLLFVAKDDRKLRIEVGYGLEGALPDVRAGRIIRDRITPEFKEGRYYEGVDSGVDGIIAAINNEADPNLNDNDQTSTDFGFGEFFWILLFAPAWLSSILARTKSWWAGGVVGAIIGVIVGVFMGLFVGLFTAAVMVPIGLFFDWAVSRNFQNRKRAGMSPSWWAGGTTLGGGGRSSGGGFGGGSFGGGGSSGSW